MEQFGASRSRLGRLPHLIDMKTTLHPASGLDPLLSIDDLAEYLGVPVATIYDWRVDAKGHVGSEWGATSSSWSET